MGARAVDDKPSDTLVVVLGDGFWTGSSTLPHLHHQLAPGRVAWPTAAHPGIAAFGDNPWMQRPIGSPFDHHLDTIRAAPKDDGPLRLIVRRPSEGERELVDEARLDPDLGLVGDRWAVRDAAATPVYLAAQVTLIAVRVLEAIEPEAGRWPLAGDQLYVDLDLSVDNLPAGTRLAIGSAVVEISETPHTGCAKFSARFGGEALRWINSPEGRAERRRGLNARIVTGGIVRVGDRVRRV